MNKMALFISIFFANSQLFAMTVNLSKPIICTSQITGESYQLKVINPNVIFSGKAVADLKIGNYVGTADLTISNSVAGQINENNEEYFEILPTLNFDFVSDTFRYFLKLDEQLNGILFKSEKITKSNGVMGPTDLDVRCVN